MRTSWPSSLLVEVNRYERSARVAARARVLAASAEVVETAGVVEVGLAGGVLLVVELLQAESEDADRRGGEQGYDWSP